MAAISDSTPIIQAPDGTEISNVGDALKIHIASSRKDFSQSAPVITFTAIDVQIGNNKSMISITNTGTTPVYLGRIFLVNSQAAAVAGIIADFRLLRFTSHSVGTLLTGISADTADVIPATLTARTGATLVGLGTVPYKRSKFSTDEWAPGGVDVESMAHIFAELQAWYSPSEDGKPITLRPNEGITIQQTVNSTVGIFTISVEVIL